MDGQIIERCDKIVDLGVVLDSDMSFLAHYNYVISKCMRMLGFIKRFGREFDDPYVLKHLYVSLVRPIIEFGCCVWSQYYQVHIDRIEMIQRRFIRFALSRLPWLDSMNLPPYVDRCKLLDIQPLQLRRINFDCMLIYDLLSGKIDCPSLLEKLSFNVCNYNFRSSSRGNICKLCFVDLEGI
jgi:hypothetical protein